MKFRDTCICGCGRQRGCQLHHVIYQQELRRIVRETTLHGPPDIIREMALAGDRRNMVVVSPKCHAAHHNRSCPFRLADLPDEAFEFARWLLGAGRAYEYLHRRYDGSDPRLDVLLAEYEKDAA
jgi:hypothetical protein